MDRSATDINRELGGLLREQDGFASQIATLDATIATATTQKSEIQRRMSDAAASIAALYAELGDALEL